MPPRSERVFAWRWAGVAFVVVCLVAARRLHGQLNVEPEVHAKTVPTEEISRPEFGARIAHLQEIVAACKLSATACGADIGPDNRVGADGGTPAFLEHWDWLRDALQEAATTKENDRAKAMGLAAAQLSDLQTETGSSNNAARIDSARAEKKVAEVLARSEFRRAAAAQPSWFDRKMARLDMWVEQAIEGARHVAEAAPWLGRLLEWTFFVLAAAGLLLFIRRNFARQQLQISMNAGAAQFSAWDREANDWAAEAEACAANRQWRDAVHCLYWAAIVRLEARRAWRHNPARTPREYVRLLPPGSAQQGALRGLTAIFERVWYGLRDPQSADYDRAKSLFTQLSDPTSAVGAGVAN